MEGKIVEYRIVKKPEFSDLQMDCANVSVVLDIIYVIDQSHRSKENYNPRQDYGNLEVVVNILEKCGMPSNPGAVKAAFLVIQHNHLIHQKK